MTINQDFCNGNLTKLEKLLVLKEYFTQGNATSAQMINDKKVVFASELPKMILYCTFYMVLGAGYAMVLNMFVKSPRAFYIFPAMSCSGFGYFKYYELLSEKARIVDTYEVEMFKKYCKKGIRVND
jgi:hypothetical protein